MSKKKKDTEDLYSFDIFANDGKNPKNNKPQKKKSTEIDIFSDNVQIKSPIIQQSINNSKKTLSKHNLPSLDIDLGVDSSIQPNPSTKNAPNSNRLKNKVEHTTEMKTKYTPNLTKAPSKEFLDPLGKDKEKDFTDIFEPNLFSQIQNKTNKPSSKNTTPQQIPKNSQQVNILPPLDDNKTTDIVLDDNNSSDDDFSSDEDNNNIIDLPSQFNPSFENNNNGNFDKLQIELLKREKLIAELKLSSKESEAKLQQQKSNNMELRSFLNEEKQKNKFLENQLYNLNKKMEENKKKEKEETEMLEKMVQNIEQNLTAANLRAQTAENNVIVLKQKLKKFQELQELLGFDEENESSQMVDKIHKSMKNHKGRYAQIKETANNASQELNKISSQAIIHIKKLFESSLTLSKVAQLLDNIDKISEVKDDY